MKTLLSRKSAESPRLVAVSWMNSTWVQINFKTSQFERNLQNYLLVMLCWFASHLKNKLQSYFGSRTTIQLPQKWYDRTGPLLPPKSLPVCLVNQMELKSEEIKNKTNIFPCLHICFTFSFAHHDQGFHLGRQQIVTHVKIWRKKFISDSFTK